MGLGCFLKRVMEDLDREQEIGLLDNQGRREANDGFMRLLGQNAAPQHGKTHVLCAGARGIEFDSRPKPFAANLDDGGMVDAGERGEQGLPKDAAPPGEILVLENAARSARYRGRNLIAAKGRAMAAGIENVHDGAPRDKRGDRHQAAAKRLANNETVGLGGLVFQTEASPRSPEARLDLIENQQYAVPVADPPETCQISPGRDDNARLALNGLDENGGRAWPDRRFERIRVAERHRDKPGRERAEPAPVGGF